MTKAKAVAAPEAARGVNIRLPNDLFIRAGEVAKRIAARAGVTVKRGAVINEALERGLALLDAEKAGAATRGAAP